MSENLPGVFVRSVGWEEPSMAGGGFVLPSGTVTLVLGDVEGSTRAWETDPIATEAAVVELNELVDELVGRFDGVRPVEQGEGDSFVAAFARARDGVACALAIQQALIGAVLKLRLGVHTGDVVRRDEGNYVGPAIIRTARLRNLAHGGQTVVSEATRELVADALPDGATLRDLGVHRLKDLSRPGRVFQLCHPDLQERFPALRSLDARPHNLPIQRTTFIGRDAAIAELSDLVGEQSLVSLTGSGGCGKTRLALQVAAELVDRFADGVWFVDLAAVGDGSGVASRVAQTLGVLAGPAMSPSAALLAHLDSAQALLVMDNCEHVLDAAAALADAVLGVCPGVSVLATSRQPLSVEGEICWRVPSLALPADVGPAGIEGLGSSEAVQLFVERASRARPGFALDDGNRTAIADICRRLDGIPLAIELAAARVRVLTAPQIAAGLSERFGLLTGAARAALPRQQTLEASLDWSHALLTDPERVVFRRLGVFAASFDLDGAVAVAAAGTIETWQVLDLLTLVVDKSLVAVDDSGEMARYRLLETMRFYAQNRLSASGEQDDSAARHRDHYLMLAETAAPYIETALAEKWYARLVLDYPNLEAALAWSRDHGDSVELCRMAAALAGVWGFGGAGLQVPPAESIGWVDSALAVADGVPPKLRAVLLWARGFLAYLMWDFPTIRVMGEKGLAIARQLDDDRLAGRCLQLMGLACAFSAEAGELWDEAAGAARRAGDTWWVAFVLTGLGGFHRLRDPHAARAALDEAFDILGGSVSPSASSMAGYVLGTLVIQEGRPEDALEILNQAHRDAIRDGSALALAGAETSRVVAHAFAGSLDEALAAAGRHANVARRTGVRLDAVELQARALVAAFTGNTLSAVAHARTALSCATTAVYRADMLVTCAQVSLAAGDVTAARSFVAEMFVLGTAEGFVVTIAEAHLLDARVKRRDGDASAEDAAHRALSAAVDFPAFMTVVDALETLAGLAAAGQSYEEAARLLGAAAALRAVTGYQLCLTERDADTALVRVALGDERFDLVYAEGRALSVADAVAYARRGRGERKRPTIGWDSLTPTEIQIVDLVGGGLTNADIGERMFVSPRTVQAHLTRIYTKLDVTSRTELAAKAATRRS